MRAVILGGGLTGCVAAHELTLRGYDTVIIEQNNYLGGGCRTFFWGGHPYTEGPRPLAIQSDKIFNYINDIVPLRKLPVYCDTYIESDRRFYSYPIHWDDIKNMPDAEKIMRELSNLPSNTHNENLEDYWLNSVGSTLYSKYVKTYTKKMWEIDDNTIFSGYEWTKKGKPIYDGDRVVKEYDAETLQAYPIEETGYNRFFDYCTKETKVMLSTKIKHIDLNTKTVFYDDDYIVGDIIVSTISLDDLFDNAYGTLRYMGRDFYPIVFPIERIFKDGHQFMYYPNAERYTRIVEYKNLTLHKSPDTLLVMEIPSHSNRLYCYDIETEQSKAKKYLESLPNNVFAVGRLGTYKYLNIGQCMESVWRLMEQL